MPTGRSLATASVFVVAALVAWLVAPPAPFFDDPYIALNAGRHLFSGPDPNYGGSPLLGATSPAYVLLLRFLFLGTDDILIVARIATALSALAVMLAAHALGRSLGLSRVEAVLLAALPLITGWVRVNIINGLETGFAVALVLGIMAWTLRSRWHLVAVGAGVLPWLRPDLAPVAAAAIGWAVWQARSARLSVALSALASALPLALLVRIEAGAWLPNTIIAKAAWSAESCQPVGWRLTFMGLGVGVWIKAAFPCAIGLIGLVKHRGRWVALGLMGTTLAAYGLLLPGGAWHNAHRYLVPILLPWALFGLAWRLTLVRSRARVGLLAGLLVIAMFWHDPGSQTENSAALLRLGDWVRHHVGPNDTVAVFDAGAVAAFSDVKIVDLIGLKTPASTEAHRRWTWPSCGADRGTALASLVAQYRPTYLVVGADWEQAFRITPGLKAHGVLLTPVVTASGTDIYRYAIYRVGAP